jgi:hypothetical protein
MLLNVDTLRIQLAAETAARQAAEAALASTEARVRGLEQQLVTLREQRERCGRRERRTSLCPDCACLSENLNERLILSTTFQQSASAKNGGRDHRPVVQRAADRHLAHQRARICRQCAPATGVRLPATRPTASHRRSGSAGRIARAG